MILLHLVQHVTELAPVLQHSPVNPAHTLNPQAMPTPTPAPTPAGTAGDAYGNIQGFLLNITNFLQILSFSIFLLSVTVAGIMYMLSLNSARFKDQALGAVVTAVVGLIITLLALGIHNIITSAFPT